MTTARHSPHVQLEDSRIPEWLEELTRYHPIFSWNSGIQRPPCHMFFRNDELFVLMGSEIRVLNILHYQRGFGDKSKDLATLHEYVTLSFPPSSPSMGDIFSFRIDRSCPARLALQCQNGLFVLELPMVVPYSSGRTRFLLSEHLYPVHRVPSSQSLIADYQWHPYSAGHNHLVVLTQEGTISIYSCATTGLVVDTTISIESKNSASFAFLSNPFQSLLIPSFYGSGPVLSDPILSDPWFYLSLFVVRRNGSIYRICPFLPRHDCLIPKKLWEAISSSRDPWLDSLRSSVVDSPDSILIRDTRENGSLLGPFVLWNASEGDRTISNPNFELDPFLYHRIYFLFLTLPDSIFPALAIASGSAIDVYVCVDPSVPAFKPGPPPMLLHTTRLLFPGGQPAGPIAFDLVLDSVHLFDSSCGVYYNSNGGIYVVPLDRDGTGPQLMLQGDAASFSFYNRPDCGNMLIVLRWDPDIDGGFHAGVSRVVATPAVRGAGLEHGPIISASKRHSSMGGWVGQLEGMSVKQRVVRSGGGSDEERLAESILYLRDEYILPLCSIQGKMQTSVQVLEEETKRLRELESKLKNRLEHCQGKMGGYKHKFENLEAGFTEIQDGFAQVYRKLVGYSQEQLSTEEKSLFEGMKRLKQDQVDPCKEFLAKAITVHSELTQLVKSGTGGSKATSELSTCVAKNENAITEISEMIDKMKPYM